MAGNGHKIRFYTGLSSYLVLMTIFAYLKLSYDEVLDMGPIVSPGRPMALQLAAVLMSL